MEAAFAGELFKSALSSEEAVVVNAELAASGVTGNLLTRNTPATGAAVAAEGQWVEDNVTATTMAVAAIRATHR